MKPANKQASIPEDRAMLGERAIENRRHGPSLQLLGVGNEHVLGQHAHNSLFTKVELVAKSSLKIKQQEITITLSCVKQKHAHSTFIDTFTKMAETNQIATGSSCLFRQSGNVLNADVGGDKLLLQLHIFAAFGKIANQRGQQCQRRVALLQHPLNVVAAVLKFF